MKLEICNFSGFKIYPGHGKLYVRGDSRVFRFINGKNASYFMQKLKPSKLNWTTVYRRLRKKGITEEVSKKRARRAAKAQRAVEGTSIDAIRAKRNQKPEQRMALRQEIVRKEKEAKKEQQAKKRAEKAKTAATSGRAAAPKAKPSKQQAKGAAPKVQAKSR